MKSKASKDHAPGIPRAEIKPVREISADGPDETWVLGLERHRARRAGEHYDLRLVDPQDGVAHSWVLPKEWPAPGEKRQLIPTFTHSVDYALRTGRWKIDDPLYGAGDVEKLVLEPVEVIKSGPGSIRFNRYGPGQRVEELSIIRGKDGQDLLYNHTLAAKIQVPGRPRYKDTQVDDLDPDDNDEVWQAKIDGAHVVVMLPKAGKNIRVFSPRVSKKSGQQIEHTHRFQGWEKMVTPAGLGGTVLRAELYGVDANGEPLSPQEVAGLLNTSVWGARLRQEEDGIRLKLAPFDVVKWRGRLAEYADYDQKLRWLRQVAEHLPADTLELPDTARDPGDKRKMLRRIKSGRHPQTREGVVIRQARGYSPPIRAKITNEREATIVGFTPGRGRLQGKAGGLVVRDDKSGVESVVGTGLGDRLRRAVAENPGLFRGVKIRVKVQDTFPSGKYRSPRFAAFHQDKNDPDRLEQIAKVAALSVFKDLGRQLGRALTGKQSRGLQDRVLARLKKAVTDPQELAALTAYTAAGLSIPTGFVLSHNRAEVADKMIREKGAAEPVTVGDLHQFAKKIGVSVRVAQLESPQEVSAYIPRDDIKGEVLESLYRYGKHVGNRKKDPRGLVIVTTKTPLAVGLHELGHAEDDQNRSDVGNAAREVATRALPWLALAAHAGGAFKAKPGLSALGTAATAAALGSVLGGEQRATNSAMSMLGQQATAEDQQILDQAGDTYDPALAGMLGGSLGMLAGDLIRSPGFRRLVGLLKR